MKTSRILPLAALALGLLFTTASSARTIEICFKDLGCFKIKRAPPPDQCDQTEHCNENACWCGPADALEWPGEDESGLPLLAREAEDAGWTCDVLEIDGVTIGDCEVTGWSCIDGLCLDDAGHSWGWTPPDVPEEPEPLIRICLKPFSEFGPLAGRCPPRKPPPPPQDCDVSSQSCDCDPAVSSCP